MKTFDSIPSAIVGRTYCNSALPIFLVIDLDSSSRYLESDPIVSIYLLENTSDKNFTYFPAEFKPKPAEKHREI